MTLLDNGIDNLPANESEPDEEQISPHLWTDDNDDAIENDQDTEHCQENEPEPEEDVNLLVNDVEWQ